jgi:hypothetical protein
MVIVQHRDLHVQLVATFRFHYSRIAHRPYWSAARSLSSASIGRFPRPQYPLSKATSQGPQQKLAANAALPPRLFRDVLAQYGPLRSGLRKPPVKRGFLATSQAMGAAEEEETAPAQQLDLRSLVPFRSGVGRSGGAHTIQPGSLRFGDGGAPVPFQIKKPSRP